MVYYAARVTIKYLPKENILYIFITYIEKYLFINLILISLSDSVSVYQQLTFPKAHLFIPPPTLDDLCSQHHVGVMGNRIQLYSLPPPCLCVQTEKGRMPTLSQHLFRLVHTHLLHSLINSITFPLFFTIERKEAY